MELDERVRLVARHCVETLTEGELRGLLERNPAPRAYIGFEPSGRLTVGHLVTARKMRDLQEAGCELTVFLADWHAWINDKLDGSLDRIRQAGRIMEASFTALGVDPEKAKYRWASELTGRSEYWARVIRIAKGTTLARTKRAMTILGRGEDETQLDTAKLFYPSMQAADIFELPVEIAYAGIDQRRAHVLAREIAHANGWPVPVALHTPLVSSLNGGGRMNPSTESLERKMSKSDPSGSISIPSTPEEIATRVRGAFCPAKEVEGNPIVDLAQHVLFPWEGTLRLAREAQHGGPVEFASASDFLKSWSDGAIHPKDLKTAVTEGLTRILGPASDAMRAGPDPLLSGP